MTHKDIRAEIVYRGDARCATVPNEGSHGGRRPARGPAWAFWLDWAPMLLLGLIVTIAGVCSIGEAMNASPSSRPVVQTQKVKPPTVLVETEPVQPSAPAVSQPVPGAGHGHEHDLRS